MVEAFAEVAGKPIGPALNDLARTRFLVGDDWDPRGLPDARAWPDANKVPATRLTPDDLPLEHAFDPPLMPTGQGFLDLDLAGWRHAWRDPYLVVDVTSASGRRSALLALWWASDGSVGEVQDTGGAPSVELSLTGIDRVVIAVTNLELPGWDGDRFLYRDGDQRVWIQVTEGPGVHVPGTGRPSGCGCASGPSPGARWLAGGWWPRRLRSRGSTRTLGRCTDTP